MDAKTAPNKLFGRGKKGTAGRGGRQKGKPTRERHFQMQMKTEWSNEKADEERGRGERNNKSVIDRGRAARAPRMAMMSVGANGFFAVILSQLILLLF